MALRTLPIIVLFCLHAPLAFAQQHVYSLKFRLSERNFADSIAIEYEGGRVFVPVAIHGTQYRFLLDTGSAQAVVYSDALPGGCKALGTIRSVDALAHETSVPLVELPPLSIGRLSISRLHATVHRRPPMRQHIDGVLGFDLVCKGLLMKIDTRRRLLVLTDRKKHFRSDPAGISLPYEVLPYRHTPYVSVEPFSGYTEQVLFDTGSPFFYRMSQQSFSLSLPFCQAQNPAQITDTIEGRFAHGLNGPEPHATAVRLLLDSLSLGGHVFCKLPAQTTQGLSHLGGPLLGYGTVLFMPHRHRISFVPYSP